MTFVAVAVGGAALVTGVVGGVLSADAAGDAAEAQVEASDRANQITREQFTQTRLDQEPYRFAGYRALQRLETLTQEPLASPGYTPTPAYDPSANPYTPTEAYSGPTEAELRADPGYQFRVVEGQKALERSAAAKGLLLSGGQLKDLTRFGQDQGAQEYAAAYGRGYQRNQDVYGRTLATNQQGYQRGYQRNADVYGRNLEAYQTGYNTLLGLRGQQYRELAGVSGAGQGALNTLAQAGTTAAGQLAQTTIGAGNAQAAGQIGEANAYNTALGGIGKAGNSFLQYQLLRDYLKRPTIDGSLSELS